jgi:hypothetical protein
MVGSTGSSYIFNLFSSFSSPPQDADNSTATDEFKAAWLRAQLLALVSTSRGAGRSGRGDENAGRAGTSTGGRGDDDAW